MRQQREDAGISQRTLGRFAAASQAYISLVEAATVEPSLGRLAALAAALGGRLSVRLIPETGPPIRDPILDRPPRGVALGR